MEDPEVFMDWVGVDAASFDDDGQELVNEYGEELIPFDRAREFSEDEAIYLSAWAQTYREVRKALTDDQNGRGFFRPRLPVRGKGDGKGKQKFGKDNMRNRPNQRM
eukprot:8903576-Alexandrium_andersonii.AAC.1